MPFTIPNEADAGNTNQAEPDAVDFDILTFGAKATGVVDGCAVTAQGTPDMTVAVAAGTVSIAGTTYLVTAANGTITAADGTNPRFDLVTINTSGTIVVTAGTAAASPVFPAHPANVVVLAAVYVAASDTAIQSTEITDKRVTIGAGYIGPMGPFSFRSGQSFEPLRLYSDSSSVNSTHAADKWYSWAFVLGADISIDGISIEVRVAGAANARIGIYQGDAAGFLPLTLIVDSGALDCSTTGIKTGAVSFALKAGVLYWIGYVTDAAAATWQPMCGSKDKLRQAVGWKKETGLDGKNMISSDKTLTYGALANPMTSPGSLQTGAATIPYFLLDVV